MKLEDAVVYISGCENGDGIGNALVIRLLSQGAKIFAVDRSVDRLNKQFADEIRKGILVTCATDVTDWKAYRRSFELLVRKFGRVDAVFLNAGVYEPQSFWNDQDEGPYSPMEVNASAAFKGTRLAIDQYLRQDSPGLIVITGSISAQLAVPKTPLYCASKWAVEGFVRSLGFLDETAGIRVVVLEPGVIKTSFWDQIGVDKNSFTDESATSIASIVRAWETIMHDPVGIPGGSAYEVSALGARLYTLDSPRSQSANAQRGAGLQELVNVMRTAAKSKQNSAASVCSFFPLPQLRMKFIVGRRRRAFLLALLLLGVLIYALRETDVEGIPPPSKPSWSTTPSFLRPLHHLAARFLPFASLHVHSPHIVLLSAFDGLSGGVEGYLAKRMVSSGSKVSLIEVPTGRTRRRVEPIDATIRRIFRDGESAEGAILAQENFSVLELDPSNFLDHHLATLFAAWPPVTGVVLFISDSRTNSSSDVISRALARSVTSRRSPWVIELDFSELGIHAEAEEAQVLSPIGIATHLNRRLRVLSMKLPPSTLLFGDAFSGHRSLVGAVAHAALGHRPISLPFLTGTRSNSLGVYSDDVAAVVHRATDAMRKSRSTGITEVELAPPEEKIDQWDLTYSILAWVGGSDALSAVSQKPSKIGRHPLQPRSVRQERLSRLLGEVTFTPILVAAHSFVSSLISHQHTYLQNLNSTTCSPDRLSPSPTERLRTIQAAHGCTAQLLTLGDDGKWWSVACGSEYPEDAFDDHLGSVAVARAVPDGDTLPSIGVEIQRTTDSGGRKVLSLQILCPASSTRTHPPRWVGDSTSLTLHGFWNASTVDRSSWRDVNAWYPSAHEAGGRMHDTFVVDLAKADPHEGFGLRLPRSNKKGPSIWLKVGSRDSRQSSSDFRPLVFQHSTRPATRFRLNPLCCAKPAGGSTGTWPGIEEDVITTSQVYFRDDAATTEKSSHFVARQCTETSRALDRIEDLLYRVRSWRASLLAPADPRTPLTVLADTNDDFEPDTAEPDKLYERICPSDCDAPVACIASRACRCATDRCGLSRQRQPGWLHSSAADFLKTNQSYLPAIDVPTESYISSIPIESLILPFARHSFRSPPLRPHVFSPAACSALESTGCEKRENSLQPHMDAIANLATPASDADFVFLATPLACPASALQPILACSLEHLKPARENEEGHGSASERQLPVLHASGLEFGSCRSVGRRLDDFVAGTRTSDISVVWSVDGSYNVPCLRSDRDVVIPPATSPSVLRDVVSDYSDLSTVKGPPNRRRYLAFFKDEVDEGFGAFARTRLGCGVAPGTLGRQTILYNQLGRHLVYSKTLEESMFCLLPRGLTGLASRLGEALYAGCIPVFISDMTHPPFHDVLDYSLFSISIPELHLARLHDILKSYDGAELQSLQAHGLRVRDYFLWRVALGGEPVPGPLDLALVATRMRIGGAGGGPLVYRR